MRIERKMCSSEVGFQLGEQHMITRMNLILLLRACVPHSLEFSRTSFILLAIFALILTHSSLERESIEISAFFTGSFPPYPLPTMPFRDESIEESISPSIVSRR